jgi:hypothetical protein
MKLQQLHKLLEVKTQEKVIKGGTGKKLDY